MANRLTWIFLRDSSGRRPVYGGAEKFQTDPHWKDYILITSISTEKTVPAWEPAIRPIGLAQWQAARGVRPPGCWPVFAWRESSGVCEESGICVLSLRACPGIPQLTEFVSHMPGSSMQMCLIFVSFFFDSLTSARVGTRLSVVSSDRGSGLVPHHSRHRCTLLRSILPPGKQCGGPDER